MAYQFQRAISSEKQVIDLYSLFNKKKKLKQLNRDKNLQ